MAITTKHGIGSPPMVDQKWATDVNNLIVNRLNWNGTTLSPEVNFVIFPKESGFGVKLDYLDPQYGWRDLLGEVRVDREAASNKPTFSVYREGIKQYQFLVNDQVYSTFHIPHDYALGTNIFIHVHWSHTNANALTGTATWGLECSQAKGHGGGSFPASKTVSIVAAPGTQYNHMISEVQLSNDGGTAGLLNTANLEPDGVILVRTFLSANSLSPATNPFLHYVDIHYQSTSLGTKQKAPNFYS